MSITTASVRDDGTTAQYVPLSYPAVADLDVTLALRESAKKLGLPWHAGIGHTKDAFYTESDEGLPMQEEQAKKWLALERANVISTSMEASALFVLGSIKGVRVGEILAVIGLTSSHEPIVKKVGVDDAIRCAIEAMKILNRR